MDIYVILVVLINTYFLTNEGAFDCGEKHMFVCMFFAFELKIELKSGV